MRFFRLRGGMVLLQTLVMSVILSMIGVMVLKWIMGRHMMAARAYRSAVTSGRAVGYFSVATSGWNYTNTPADDSRLVSEPLTSEAQKVCIDSQGSNRFVISVDEDKLDANTGTSCP